MSTITSLRTILTEQKTKEEKLIDDISIMQGTIDLLIQGKEELKSSYEQKLNDANQATSRLEYDLNTIKQYYQTSAVTVATLNREVEYTRQQYTLLQQQSMLAQSSADEIKNMNEGYQRTISNLQQDISTLEKSMNDFTQQYSQMKMENTKLMEENSSLREAVESDTQTKLAQALQIEQKCVQLSKTEEDNQRLEVGQRDLSQQLISLEVENLQFRQQIELLEGQCKKLEADIAAKRLRLEEMEQNSSTVVKSPTEEWISASLVADLQLQLKVKSADEVEMKSELERHRRGLHDAYQRIQLLGQQQQQMCIGFQAQIVEGKAYISSLEMQLQQSAINKEESDRSLLSKLELAQSESDSNGQELIRTRESNETLQMQLTNNQSQLDSFRQQLEELTKQNEALEHRVADESESGRRELQEKEKLRNFLHQTVADLQQRISQLEHTLNASNQRYQSDMTMCQREIMSGRRQCIMLQQQLQSCEQQLLQRIQQAQEDSAALHKQIKMLEETVAASQEREAQSQVETQRDKQEISSLQSATESLTHALAAKCAALQQLSGECDQQTLQWQSQLQAYESKCRDKDGEIESLSGHVRAREEDCMKLKSRLQELEIALEEHSERESHRVSILAEVSSQFECEREQHMAVMNQKNSEIDSLRVDLNTKSLKIEVLDQKCTEGDQALDELRKLSSERIAALAQAEAAVHRQYAELEQRATGRVQALAQQLQQCQLYIGTLQQEAAQCKQECTATLAATEQLRVQQTQQAITQIRLLEQQVTDSQSQLQLKCTEVDKLTAQVSGTRTECDETVAGMRCTNVELSSRCDLLEGNLAECRDLNQRILTKTQALECELLQAHSREAEVSAQLQTLTERLESSCHESSRYQSMLAELTQRESTTNRNVTELRVRVEAMQAWNQRSEHQWSAALRTSQSECERLRQELTYSTDSVHQLTAKLAVLEDAQSQLAVSELALAAAERARLQAVSAAEIERRKYEQQNRILTALTRAQSEGRVSDG